MCGILDTVGLPAWCCSFCVVLPSSDHIERTTSVFTGRNVTYDFSGQFLPIFAIIIVCFVVAICDLVDAVEAMYDLP